MKFANSALVMDYTLISNIRPPYKYHISQIRIMQFSIGFFAALLLLTDVCGSEFGSEYKIHTSLL